MDELLKKLNIKKYDKLGLEAAIETLEVNERKVIQGKYFNHKSYGELARNLRTPMKKIEQIEHKAIEKLCDEDRSNLIQNGIYKYFHETKDKISRLMVMYSIYGSSM